MTVYTIGHSTHSLSRLVELLSGTGIERLADVRTVPRSRRVPQFNREALAGDLPDAGIEYLHFPELGGWRSPHAGIEDNAGWRNRSFRGYADHMQTAEFGAGLERLGGWAAERATAVMCAEAAWWRCHRRLVADALVVRGWEVVHLAAGGRAVRHELTPFAVRDGERLSYPPAQGTLGA